MSLKYTGLDREAAIKALIKLGIPGRYAEEAAGDADADPGKEQKPWLNIRITRQGKTYTVERI